MNIKAILPKTVWRLVPDGFKNLIHLFEAFWANVYFGFPGRRLRIVGVTGTDGKTTTAYFIYSILRAAGKNVALISTVGVKIDEREIDTGFHVTTPDSWQLQKFIKQIVDCGNEFLVLEVTSHGLDQHRVWGLPFEVGVLTNITHEHLDYHQTFENYLKAKAKLFQSAKISILNKDDPSFESFSEISKEFFWYSRSESVGLTLLGNLGGFPINLRGLTMAQLREKLIEVKLLGDYNWSNALAAALTARSLGISWEAIKAGIEAVNFIPGRMEEIANDRGFRIFVDFAHTPNALEQVLKLSSRFKVHPSFAKAMEGAPRSFNEVEQSSKLIVVFGCAGERDKTKRTIMGEIAGKLADIAILTAEDPRTEDVNEIIDQIVQGSVRGGAIENYSGNLEEPRGSIGRFFVRIPDRKKAIELGLRVANIGDCVIITGKGHEKSMCFGETEYPWSDQEIIRQLLKLPR